MNFRWYGRNVAPIVTVVLCALAGYGAAEIVLQLGLWKVAAWAAGIIAFVANLLNDWPQPEDVRD